MPEPSWELLLPNDERLRSICEPIPVEEITSPEVQATINTMLEVASGQRDVGPGKNYMVGLAGPQIGIMQRVIVVDMDIRMGKKPKDQTNVPKPTVFINPEIVAHSQETEDFREGCFSFHAKEGIYGVIPRYKTVTVKAYDRDGHEVEVKAESYTARIFQHEIDHLDGIRYYQHISEGHDLDQVTPDELEDYKDSGWKTWLRKVSLENLEK